MSPEVIAIFYISLLISLFFFLFVICSPNNIRRTHVIIDDNWVHEEIAEALPTPPRSLRSIPYVSAFVRRSVPDLEIASRVSGVSSDSSCQMV